jgi:hypothetical protein
MAWSEVAASDGPAAREDHTWTADPDGAVAYLFGGRNGATVFDDLWSYDLAADTWTRVQPSGASPPPRFGHSAAWATGVGLVIAFGQAGSTFYNDLWAFDPAENAWRQLPSDGAIPVPRYGSCAAIGPDGLLWISHGFTSDGSRFADTLAYDFEAGAWTDQTPLSDRPVPRCLHGCWWTGDDRFVLYAGQTTGVTSLGDLWHLTVGERPGTNAWSEAGGPLPEPRNLYAAARVDGTTIVFGGQGADGGYLTGAWRFDDATPGATALTTTGGSPAPRAGAELIHDAERGRLLLFGGKGPDGALGDLWALSGF